MNEGNVHHCVRGKMLGSSSGINYMVWVSSFPSFVFFTELETNKEDHRYVRGSDADYDDWAALANDKSWSSRKMKQYMRKHQTLEPFDEVVTDRSTMPFVSKNHGTSGSVRTSFNPWRSPIEDAVIQAFDDALGYTKKPTDPRSGDHIGFHNTLGTIA